MDSVIDFSFLPPWMLLVAIFHATPCAFSLYDPWFWQGVPTLWTSNLQMWLSCEVKTSTDYEALKLVIYKQMKVQKLPVVISTKFKHSIYYIFQYVRFILLPCLNMIHGYSTSHITYYNIQLHLQCIASNVRCYNGN